MELGCFRPIRSSDNNHRSEENTQDETQYTRNETKHPQEIKTSGTKTR